MANTQKPRGAWVIGRPLRLTTYQAGGTIYPGDFVKHNSSGQVVVAAAGDALLGVSDSYATSGQDVAVYDHPDQMFGVQASGTDITAQTNLMLNYNIVATAGSSSYKMSRMALDSATGATTATLPLRLVNIEARPDNTIGSYADCIVKINNHQFSGGTGTVGT